MFATQYELKRCKEIVAFLIKRNLISENVLMILQRANDHDVSAHFWYRVRGPRRMFAFAIVGGGDQTILFAIYREALR